MKKKTDFQASEGYDWSLFSEDRRMYREPLESAPYDPELARFFYYQKRLEQKWEKERSRHLSEYRPGFISEQEPPVSVPDMQEIREAVGTLTEAEQRRLVAYMLGYSGSEIARMEHSSPSAVHRSIRRSRSKLRSALFG